MNKQILILVITTLAIFTIGVIVVYASTEITFPIYVDCQATEGEQLCGQSYDFSFTTDSDGRVLAQIDGELCSSLRIHFYLDGNFVSTSEWLGWPDAPDPYDTLPLSTGQVNLGQVNSGTHVVGFLAEGQESGCNYGTLWGWAGNGKIVFEQQIDIDIDIKPGNFPNCFNSNGHGVIPVAILSTTDFNASTVDPFSVALDGSEVRVKGKSGNAGSLEDVDDDGDLDLVVQILDDNIYSIGQTIANLSGYTFDGVPIIGSDSICITQD